MELNKKEYLISLFKKYGEYDETINWDDLDSKSIDKMYDVLVIKDEQKRAELINSYKEEEIKKMKEKRKKAEELLGKVRKLSNQIKEIKSNLEDKRDIKDLENQMFIS